MRKNSDDGKNIRNVDDLYEFELKEIKVRKIIWVLLSLVWMSGFVGLFGRGWLSSSKSEGGIYSIEYERFLRDETSTSLSIFMEESSGDTVEISLGMNYVQKIMIQRITPEPFVVKVTENRVIYSFLASESAIIIYYFIPQQTGFLELDVLIQGDQRDLKQFVFI